MIWHGWSDFVHMGGYGFYVWGSFLVTAVLVAAETGLLRQRGRNALKRARLAAKFSKERADENEA
jgi:heme exporter protein D